jgi:YGGT family
LESGDGLNLHGEGKPRTLHFRCHVREKGHEMQQDPSPKERPIPNTSDVPYEQPVSDEEGATNVPPQAAYPSTRDRIYRYAKLIGYIGWAVPVLDILLLLCFFFKLIGADPQSPFALFLYALTGFFLSIFKGIVPDLVFGSSNQFVLEWSTIIAMISYGIIGWILISFLRTRITPPEEYIP